MIPKTEDGRVLFILPWHGHTLVGTTDDPAEITDHPKAKDEEIDYLLRHVGHYFNLKVTKTDIKSVWSGLRPLVFDPKAADTSKLVRDHLILESDSKLVTIAGGKWTSYRKMAEDTVDHAIKAFGFRHARPCQTKHLRLAGGASYSKQGDAQLIKEFGLAPDVAKHLNGSYGDRAVTVAKLAAEGLGNRLHSDHPYLEAEVVYAASHEFAERASDVLTRRTALALLDIPAAAKAATRVIALMTQVLDWNEERCREEEALVSKRLSTSI
jgi:glycerol-3-phosphate dehydrogenase